MNETKILIINHFGTNKGDAAILIGTVDTLKRIIPDAKITIESSDPKITAERTNHNAKIVERVVERKENKNLLIWGFKIVLWVFQSAVWGVLKRCNIDIRWLFNEKKNSLLNEYEKADIILSGGGGYIRDNTGMVGFLPLYYIVIALLIRKPVMLYAQSIGPINSDMYKFVAKYILNKVHLITLRDIASKEVLQDLKVNKVPIYVTSDAAFLFHQTIQSQCGEFILVQEGISKKDHKLVGITLMRWHYPRDMNPELKHENYKKTMAEVSDHLIEKLNVTVVFISMNTKEQRDDEINLAKEILQIMKHKEDAKIITGEYTPEELKDIISQMELVIGTRFHSVIFAITVGVPVVSIMYEHKAIGIMKMLGMERFVCDISELKKDDPISKIDEVWSERNKIKNNLESDVRVLQELALLNAKFVNQLIDFSRNEDQKEFLLDISPEDKSVLDKFN